MLAAGLASASNSPGSASVLFSGRTGLDGIKRIIGDADAVSQERLFRVSWLKLARGLYDANLGQNFACPPEPAFVASLRRVSRLDSFTVRSVTCHQSPQTKTVVPFAPLVVIESDNYVRTAAAVSSIFRAVDPLTSNPYIIDPYTSPQPLYPVFIELVDDRGVPYAAVSHFANGSGEWARANALFPYPTM